MADCNLQRAEVFLKISMIPSQDRVVQILYCKVKVFTNIYLSAILYQFLKSAYVKRVYRLGSSQRSP